MSLFLVKNPSAKNDKFLEMYWGRNLERVHVIPLGLMARVIPSSVPSISQAWLSTIARVPCKDEKIIWGYRDEKRVKLDAQKDIHLGHVSFKRNCHQVPRREYKKAAGYCSRDTRTIVTVDYTVREREDTPWGSPLSWRP